MEENKTLKEALERGFKEEPYFGGRWVKWWMIESKSLRQVKDNHRFSAASAKGEVKLNAESEKFSLSIKLTGSQF
jgi:hypothetical protein